MFKLVNKEMAGTLRYSIIAGEVCSMLELLRAGESFQVRDEKVLNRAIQFLSNAQEGKRFTEKLELNERAFDASEAYGETVKVLKTIYLKHEKKTLEEIINSLKSSLEEIKNEKRIIESKEKEYDNLKMFFSTIRQLAAEQRSRPYEKIEIVSQKE